MSATTMGESWPYRAPSAASSAHSPLRCDSRGRSETPCAAVVIAIAIVAAVGGKTAASLCAIQGEELHPIDSWIDSVDSCAADGWSGPSERIKPGYYVDRGRYDWLEGGRYDYLDQFQYRLLGGSRHGWLASEHALGFVAAIRDSERAFQWPPTTGVYLDRWRYAYLDQGRYRFLDLTQYHMLGRFRGMGWCCHHGWCGNDVAFVQSRCVPPPGKRDPAIPEPCTATLFALGALIVLRPRKREDLR